MPDMLCDSLKGNMTKAFWVKFKFVDGLTVDETNKALDEYFKFTWSLKCSSDGGPVDPWSWKELVHVSREKQDVTETDRQALIKFLEKHKLITEFQIGELVMWEEAYEASTQLIKDSIIQHFSSEEFQE
jgi:uncharacterized protein YggL (DUF469 family)